MNLDRFSKIVAAYGARADAWPVEERDDAINFMQSNAEAQELLQYERVLDQQLETFDPAYINIGTLKSRIVATVKNNQKTLLDVLLAWFLPENPLQLWRPALAASFPLVIGILVGMNIEVSQLESNDSWDEEFCIMALTVDCVEFIDEQ